MVMVYTCYFYQVLFSLCLQIFASIAILKQVSDIRSSEVILNTINHGNQFYKCKKHLTHVFKYTRDDNSENSCIKNHTTCGDVIVATNLAGRGTDIKLDKARCNKVWIVSKKCQHQKNHYHLK